MITNLHRVMHSIAIKQKPSVGEIADASDLMGALAKQILVKAEESGRIVCVDDRYLLTPAGRMILESEYSRFYYELRRDQAFISSHDQFEQINNNLKQVITDWQTVEIGGKKITNEHNDRDYDDKIIRRLGDIHERIEPVLDRMASREMRFNIYKAKLLNAIEKAEEGEIVWVSDTKCESYHTVWFEMHEDVLRILGREREE